MTSLSTDDWFLKDLKSSNQLPCFLGRTLNSPIVFNSNLSLAFCLKYTIWPCITAILLIKRLYFFSKQLNLLVKSPHTSLQLSTFPKILFHFLNWVPHNTTFWESFFSELKQEAGLLRTSYMFVHLENLHKQMRMVSQTYLTKEPF